jgi:Myb-like DNA-binding protein REB1
MFLALSDLKINRVDSLGVRDDTEIDWKTLSDPDWNLWSAHTLQRRWLTMKRSIKGYENMTHGGKHVYSIRVVKETNSSLEIMDILRVKKAHLPPPTLPSTKKRKERRVTSAAAIPDADIQNGRTIGTRTGSENTTSTNTPASGEPESKLGSDSDSDSSESSESD